ncbi:probable plastid-lipid-associated protein 3, chloroplastic [Impatiens glandulifera]|uniref:probable plastid-lipid-associated protein 3, chloroplastic n=1 Tax=Impatiens glandulifera TaxID=253017 RepID=UPI001FB09FE1|nr:probable plastid-lipid-associated protein 3, chloroplastic [Impatiens glandulifera]
MKSMAAHLLTPSFLLSRTTTTTATLPLSCSRRTHSLKFPLLHTSSSSSRNSSSIRSSFTFSGDSDDKLNGPPSQITDEWGEKSGPEPDSSTTKLPETDPPINEDEWQSSANDNSSSSEETRSGVVDEWGEIAVLETEPSTKLPSTDPTLNEDEWGDDSTVPPAAADNDLKEDETKKAKLLLEELKRCLVDTLYGVDLGFRASAEVRAEASELISQLEAANPTPAPSESPELLDGNWVLLYTAFSELLPILAAGSTPLLKVDKISQLINTNNLTIENSVTFSNPFVSLSFSATANFDIRSPSRIQVEFKEGVFKPPEIKTKVDVPENVDIFGQKISLLPLQQSSIIGPLQEAVAGIARAISGQPPIKVQIPGGQRSESWLLTTYLDNDFRISRGDGGIFVLAKEGSPLLDI